MTRFIRTDQIFAHVRREIEHFFSTYEELEGKVTKAGSHVEGGRAAIDKFFTLFS
jgi:hypothetical protein